MKDFLSIIVGILAGVFAPYYLAKLVCYVDSNYYGTCDESIVIQWVMGLLFSIILAFACGVFVAITYGMMEYLKEKK